MKLYILPSVSKQFQELKQLLYSVCSPEGVDQMVKKNQLYLREELASTGQLYRELAKRGYQPNRNHLIPLEQG